MGVLAKRRGMKRRRIDVWEHGVYEKDCDANFESRGVCAIIRKCVKMGSGRLYRVLRASRRSYQQTRDVFSNEHVARMSGS